MRELRLQILKPALRRLASKIGSTRPAPRSETIGPSVIAAAITVFYGVTRMRGVEVDVVQVREQSLVQTVVATGRVMSPARVEIGSVITGRVVKVAVREGDQVEVGQTLIELDQSELSASLKQAEAAEQSARARLANVSELGLATAAESLTQAKATMEWNQAELKRNRKRPCASCASRA